MSKAMKCDRCGQYFDRQILSEDHVICANISQMGNVKVERVTHWFGAREVECSFTAELIDLCPDCLHSFGDWFNGRYNQEEETS